MQNLNIELFNLINAGANLTGIPLYFGIFIAKYLVYFIVLWMIAYWLWGNTKYRGTLLFAIIAAEFTILINKIIGLIWYQPRPFAMGLGHQYLAHAPTASFPSDHTAFLWAIGLSLLLQTGLRLQGSMILLLALCVGCARIFLGIHFPADIVGGIFTATFAVLIIDGLRPWINTKILPFIETLYRKIFAKVITKQIVKS